MSKTTSLDLFTLIKSLSKQEKRHFKIYSSRHVVGRGNNYVRLFDAIEKQKMYDEKKIMQTEKYISSMAVEKNRLYSIILKSLVINRSVATIEQEIKNHINFIEVLHNKGLYDQCEKIIEKAGRIAAKHDLFGLSTEIMNWKIKIMSADSYQKYNFNEIDSTYCSLNGLLDKQKELNKNILFNVMSTAWLRKYGQPRNEQAEVKYKYHLKPYFIENEDGLSFTALISHYNAKGLYYGMLGNYAKKLVYETRLVKLLEARPHFIEINPREYAMSIYGFIHGSIMAKSISAEVYAYIDKLKNLNFDSEMDKRLFSQCAYFLEMCCYCYVGEYEKSLLIVNKLRSLKLIGLNRGPGRAEFIDVGLHFQCAETYFALGDYKKSNTYLNEMIHFDSKISGNLRSSRILRLINDMEMENSDLMEYSLKSTYRYLLRNTGLSKFEILILDFLKQQLKRKPTNKELIDLYKKLKLDLEKLENDRFEKVVLAEFPYICWLESKITGKSFADVVRAKWKSG